MQERRDGDRTSASFEREVDPVDVVSGNDRFQLSIIPRHLDGMATYIGPIDLLFGNLNVGKVRRVNRDLRVLY